MGERRRRVESVPRAQLVPVRHQAAASATPPSAARRVPPLSHTARAAVGRPPRRSAERSAERSA